MHPIALCRAVLFLLLVAAADAGAASLAETRALLEAGDNRAPAAIAALVKAAPGDADARVLQVRLLLRQNNAKEAIAIAEAAVGRAPGNAQAHYWLGNAYGSRVGQVGMLSKLVIAPKLRGAFEQAVVLDPNLLEARSALVQFYLLAPATVGGGIDKARAQAVEIGKRDVARGHLARAQILTFEKKPTQALQAYESAYAARTGNAEIRMALGIAYQRAEQWDKAHAHFQQWTRQEPRAAGAWFQLGRSAVLSGRHLPEGVLALDRFLTLPAAPATPERKHAYLRLGQLHALAGNKDLARNALQAALKIDPAMADAKTALGKL